MQKCSKWLIRIMVLIVIISVFFCLASSASAVYSELFTAGEYITKVVTYENLSEVTYVIPADKCYVLVYDICCGWRSVCAGDGKYHDIGFVPGHNYIISLSPIGYHSNVTGFLCDTLPSAFNLSTGFGFSYMEGEDTGYASICTPSAYMNFYNSYDNTALASIELNMQNQNGKTHVTTDRNPIDMSKYSDIPFVTNFEFMWSNVSWQSDPVPTGMIIDDLVLTCVVDNQLLYDHFFEWSQGIDPELKKSLSDKISPLSSSVNIDKGDIDQMEDDMIDYIEDNWSAIDQMGSGLVEVIGEIAPALLCISWMIETFVQLHFFSVLMNVIISLGLTAFVLNLGITVINKYRGGSGSEKSKGGGKS